VHNWLLKIDVPDCDWILGALTNYEEEVGLVDICVTLFAWCCLINPLSGRCSGSYDTSGMGIDTDRMCDRN
jgi:hypothetical protein